MSVAMMDSMLKESTTSLLSAVMMDQNGIQLVFPWCFDYPSGLLHCCFVTVRASNMQKPVSKEEKTVRQLVNLHLPGK